MKKFSTFDIAYILDFPRERLQEWLKRGFIKPSIQEAKGQGTKNIFSRSDIYGIYIFDKMVKRGTSREFASKVFHNWQSKTKDFHIEDFKKKETIVCGFSTSYKIENKPDGEFSFNVIPKEHINIIEDKDYGSPYFKTPDGKTGFISTHPEILLDWKFWEEMRIINLEYVYFNVDGAIKEYEKKSK